MIGGIDLGSAWLAAVVAEDDLPLRLTEEPRTFAVTPDEPEIVVAVVVELFVKAGVTRAAIEFGRFYAGEAPTPGQLVATANTWATMKLLRYLFMREFAAEGIEVVTMDRRTWSSRLVPHHKGGVSTAEACEGIAARCGEGTWERLRDQHQRDAAGVLLGAWLVDAPPRLKRVRRRKGKPAEPRPEPTPEQIAARKARLRAYKTAWQAQKRGGSKMQKREENVRRAIAHGSWLR